MRGPGLRYGLLALAFAQGSWQLEFDLRFPNRHWDDFGLVAVPWLWWLAHHLGPRKVRRVSKGAWFRVLTPWLALVVVAVAFLLLQRTVPGPLHVAIDLILLLNTIGFAVGISREPPRQDNVRSPG